jgi:hypothetical protein
MYSDLPMQIIGKYRGRRTIDVKATNRQWTVSRSCFATLFRRPSSYPLR